MNRRNLLQGLSLSVLSAKSGVGMSLFSPSSAAQPKQAVAANDRINVAIIGPGSRGQELVRKLLRTPGVEIAAACDVYPQSYLDLNELVGKNVPAYNDYKEILARPDIDAIVIATPPVFHAEYAINAMKSGKPVYGEKTLGFSTQDCSNVLQAVKETGQIFQIGHQMRYAPWAQETIKRVHRGDIGVPTHVYSYWHRSDNWRRPVPDPSLEHIINWRLYTESSGGLLEELGSHAIDIANWVFQEHPQTVTGSSSIAVYHDGRTVGDNVQAVIGYSGGRRMFFSSITDNAMMGDQLWIYGTEGSVQLTLEDATFYSPTNKYITAVSHAQVAKRGIKTGASYQANWEMPYRGPGERVRFDHAQDPTLVACHSFIDCVRNKQQPLASATVGYGSAIACSVGKEAIQQGRTMTLPQLAKS